jgi:hypothetical protein
MFEQINTKLWIYRGKHIAGFIVKQDKDSYTLCLSSMQATEGFLAYIEESLTAAQELAVSRDKRDF